MTLVQSVQTGSNHNNVWSWLERVTTLLTLVASGTALWLLLPLHRGPQIADNRQIEQPVEDVLDRTPLPVHVDGSKAAKVILIEFADFGCPFCKRHAKETLPTLQADFINTGVVRYAFRHFPLQSSEFAGSAAAFAECAGRQGVFWEAHRILLGAGFSGDTHGVARELTARGADSTVLERCAASEDSTVQLKLDIDEARRLGVSATPTFFVGLADADASTVKLLKRIRGAQSTRVFSSIIQWATRQQL